MPLDSGGNSSSIGSGAASSAAARRTQPPDMGRRASRMVSLKRLMKM